MALQRYAFALDLKDDPKLIAEYEAAHQQVWPEVIANFKKQGIVRVDLYRLGTRLFMLMEVDTERYNAERMAEALRTDPVLAKWEELMWTYQAPTPWTPAGEKWSLMSVVFEWASAQ